MTLPSTSTYEIDKYCIAHRGKGPTVQGFADELAMTTIEPENSLRAFKYAFDKGVHGIELDAYLALDAVVVIHGGMEGRVGGDNPKHRHLGFIKDKTLAELRQFDAGKGERIPTLVQVLEWALEAMKQRRFMLNIELKVANVGLPTIKIVESFFKKGLPEDSVFFCSYHHEELRKVREHNSRVLISPALTTSTFFDEVRVPGWHISRDAEYSTEAYSKLSKIIGVLHPDGLDVTTLDLRSGIFDIITKMKPKRIDPIEKVFRKRPKVFLTTSDLRHYQLPCYIFSPLANLLFKDKVEIYFKVDEPEITIRMNRIIEQIYDYFSSPETKEKHHSNMTMLLQFVSLLKIYDKINAHDAAMATGLNLMFVANIKQSFIKEMRELGIESPNFEEFFVRQKIETFRLYNVFKKSIVKEAQINFSKYKNIFGQQSWDQLFAILADIYLPDIIFPWSCIGSRSVNFTYPPQSRINSAANYFFANVYKTCKQEAENSASAQLGLLVEVAKRSVFHLFDKPPRSSRDPKLSKLFEQSDEVAEPEMEQESYKPLDTHIQGKPFWFSAAKELAQSAHTTASVKVVYTPKILRTTPTGYALPIGELQAAGVKVQGYKGKIKVDDDIYMGESGDEMPDSHKWVKKIKNATSKSNKTLEQADVLLPDFSDENLNPNVPTVQSSQKDPGSTKRANKEQTTPSIDRRSTHIWTPKTQQHITEWVLD